MKTTSNHTHDAWVPGLHTMPGMVDEWAIPADMVLVHDLDNDEWHVLYQEDFEDQFDWIVIEETIEVEDYDYDDE